MSGGHFAESGVITLFSFMALLSINLGLINLFPDPHPGRRTLAFLCDRGGSRKAAGRKGAGIRVSGLVWLLSLVLWYSLPWNDFVHLSVLDFIKGY